MAGRGDVLDRALESWPGWAMNETRSRSRRCGTGGHGRQRAAACRSAGPGQQAARARAGPGEGPPAWFSRRMGYLIGGGPKGKTLRPKVDSMMSPTA